MSTKIDINTTITNCLNDIRVELHEEFSQNFRRQGFFNEKWKRRKVDLDPDRPILTHRGSLQKSILSQVVGAKIVFTSSLPYSKIHNDGGAITVTARMKGYFYHKYLEMKKGGKEKDTIAIFYLSMARKRKGSKIIIPRRRFIGAAPEVEKIVCSVIEENLTEYFNKLSFKIK